MLALLAGTGRLPYHVISACEQRGEPFLVVGFEGQTDPHLLKSHRHVWVRMGAIGATLSVLKREGVTQIVMAGAVRRPTFSELSLDGVGASWVARIGMKAFGDDGLL